VAGSLPRLTGNCTTGNFPRDMSPIPVLSGRGFAGRFYSRSDGIFFCGVDS
jgi:hypothetical protein